MTLYKEARARRVSERQAFRARHGRNVPYPEHLSALPRYIDIDWLHEEMEKMEKEEAMDISQEEWEYARGCLSKVRYTYNSLFIYDIIISYV